MKYESKRTLSQYLLLHYGSDLDQMPFAFGPKNSLHFPVRCVTESLDVKGLPPQAKALDLGCAVGASSFELSRTCGQVMAIDRSQTFIEAATKMQQEGKLAYTLDSEEGSKYEQLARLPDGVLPERIIFRCLDVMEFDPGKTRFDAVLAINLICRLPDPRAFLKLLKNWVASGGQLIIATPYTWLEEFTPPSYWLYAAELHELLKRDFAFQSSFDLPFLIREHFRKYEWAVSEVSLWRRAF